MTVGYCELNIHAAVPNTATILGTLAVVLGEYHAILGLANVFFSITWLPSHKINLPSHGRGKNGPFKCLPKAICTALQYVMRQ